MKKLLLTLFIFTLACSACSAGDLVLSMDFEEAAGALADDSGHGNNGAITGTPTYQVGGAPNRGYAMQFDGIGDYATITDSGELDIGAAGSFTIAAWVKPNATPGTSVGIADKRGTGAAGTVAGWVMFQAVNGRVDFILDDGAGDSARTQVDVPVTCCWVHIVVVVDRGAGNAFAYMCGALKDTQSVAAVGSAANATDLLLGARPSGPTDNFWAGCMDELRIYDHALTAAQVQHLYQQGGGRRAN